MAIVATPKNTNRAIQVGTLSLANAGNYVTGGLPVTAGMFSMSSLYSLDVKPDSGYVFEYNPTNNQSGLLKMFDTGASSGAVLAETANSTVVSGLTSVKYTAIGA